MPEVTPDRHQSATHDFTLQAVMELHKSVATMTEKLDRVCSDVRDFGAKLEVTNEKIETLRRWQARLLGGTAVLIAVVTIIWSVVNLVPWERVKLEPAAKSASVESPSADSGK